MKLKTLIIVALIVLASLITWVGLPFIRAAILAYQFNRYIHVRLDVPRCSRMISQQIRCCLCLAAFEGKISPSDIRFTGGDVTYKYDAHDRTYLVSGNGTITDGTNTIEIRSGRILLNGRDVPDSAIPMRVLMTKEGDLVNGYVH